MDMFGVAVLIFLVTDPFGNIAVFLAALKGVAPGRRLRVAFRELAFAWACCCSSSPSASTSSAASACPARRPGSRVASSCS